MIEIVKNWVRVTNVGATIPKACGFEAATRRLLFT
jgi:hypothetical protein